MPKQSSESVQQPDRLRVGRLTKPHGLKGAIKLELFTDSPELRFKPGSTFELQVPPESPWFGKTITIRELKWFNGHPVGFFEEIPDRTAAEGIVKAIAEEVASKRATGAGYGQGGVAAPAASPTSITLNKRA